MHIFTDTAINIYFGDSSDNLFMHEHTYDLFAHASSLLAIEPFSHLHDTMAIDTLAFPRQVHGTTGYVVNTQTIATIKPFSLQGDYLITNTPGVGLGILTADCLPVLLHDTQKQAIAAIHAGWRGSVAGIVIKAVEHMAHAFGSKPSDIRAFFGPSAGSCCYSVGTEVAEAVKPFEKQVLHKRNGNLYFDLIHYNRILLQHADIHTSACCNSFAPCTICNHQFWSYRRQQQNAGRQVTVISLR